MDNKTSILNDLSYSVGMLLEGGIICLSLNVYSKGINI